MGTSKHFLLLAIFTMFLSFPHLTPSLVIPLTSYEYESPLNYSIALTVWMLLGTPPQRLRMVLDTGSQLSWVQCRGKSPFYNTSASSSFSNVTCKDRVCVTNPYQITDYTLPLNCSHRLCRYSYGFNDGTIAKGNLVREQFDFTNSQTTPPLVIGCSLEKDPMTGADGMLGMNRGRLSFISQLNQSKFSYCVPLLADNSKSATGTFCLGDNPYSNSFQYTNLLNTSQQSQFMADFDNFPYYVGLVSISINGQRLNISSDMSMVNVNPNGTFPMMIDSGSRHTYLVDAAYDAVREKVANLTGASIKEKSAVDKFDMCFVNNANLSDVREKIGDVVFELEEEVNISIPAERTLDYISDEHGVCVAIGRSTILGASTSIIGYSYQQNLCVEFDINTNKVGFGKAYDSKP